MPIINCRTGNVNKEIGISTAFPKSENAKSDGRQEVAIDLSAVCAFSLSCATLLRAVRVVDPPRVRGENLAVISIIDVKKRHLWYYWAKMIASVAPCEIIASCALFTNLSIEECGRIVAAGRVYELPPGGFFFQQGEDSTMLYVILTGRVKLSQVTSEGNQVIVNYFGPGEGLGIVMALNELPYPLSAEAIEPCAAVGWGRDAMLDLMKQNAQLAINGMNMVGRRFAQMQNRFQELATQRVEQRLARALMRLVRQFGRRTEEGVVIDIALGREDLAQMTGTNLYNVSRILSKWEGDGLIATGRKRVTLIKAHELVILAEDIPIPGQPP